MDSQNKPLTEMSAAASGPEIELSDEEHFEMLQSTMHSNAVHEFSDSEHFEEQSDSEESNEETQVEFLTNPQMGTGTTDQLHSDDEVSSSAESKPVRVSEEQQPVSLEHASSSSGINIERATACVTFSKFVSCPECSRRLETNSRIHELQRKLVDAIHNNHVDTVKELLETKGLNPDFDIQNRSPVCRAAATGNIRILRLLLEAGAHPNTPNYADLLWERRPVHIAASRGHLSALQLLIQHGASINQHDSDHRTPLHWVAMYGQDHMIKWMIQAGAGVNLAQTDGFTPLHTATCLGHKEVCRLLLEGGADIACRDRDGWTALHTAVCYGYSDIVELLMEMGADPLTRTTSNYDSTLHIACSKGNVEIMKLLLRKGVDIEGVNSYGSTPLFTSVYYNRLYSTYYLIKAGANVNAKSNTGTSPMYLAAIRCEMETLGMLIGAGCHIDKGISLPVAQQSRLTAEQMESLASKPQSLIELCLVVIRQALAPNLQKNAKHLPVPQSVKRAIALKDLTFSLTDGHGEKLAVTSDSEDEECIITSNGLKFKVVPKA